MAGSEIEWYLILFRASEALEMTYLRKISLFVYKELIMMSIKRDTSASKSYSLRDEDYSSNICVNYSLLRFTGYPAAEVAF